MHTYKTKGVCSRSITVDVADDVITHISFVGGCDGNLKAISKLCVGKNVDEVVELLAGNTCGSKQTSCADQLTYALREAQAQA
ncbi:TIGR03905 family TSCPD domain-containing protein [Eggerthellaceae bacterium 3-80]|nr:TIGR03905 family TSCPD domain-containing protein [bacterium D16-34]